jgi:hypothetical protein
VDQQESYWIICPDYPPSTSGLAGHTLAFSKALRLKSRVRVLTSKESKSDHEDVFCIIKKWSIFTLIFSYFQNPIFCKDKESRIVIQYLPFLYNPRGGINLSISFFAIFLRLRGHKIDLICHELHYPLFAHWKAVILFTCHIMMLSLMGIASARIFTTTNFFLTRAKKILFWRERLYFLPVGSNMEFHKVTKAETENFLNKHGLKDKYLITIFGTIHPTRYMREIISAIIDWQSTVKIPSALIIIGETTDRIEKEIGRNLFNKLIQNGFVAGKIEPKDFSIAMSASHISVSYFSDGATTRRGSLMASLQHGVKTVSTLAPHTDSALQLMNELKLLPCELNQFSSGLRIALSQCASTIVPPSRLASAEYNNNFDWKQIITRFRGAGLS